MKQIEYTKQTIKDAIVFLTTGQLPESMPRMSRFRFRNRFLSGHYGVIKNNDGSQTLVFDNKPVLTKTEAMFQLKQLYSYTINSRHRMDVNLQLQ
jgi:hypothetical protein